MTFVPRSLAVLAAFLVLVAGISAGPAAAQQVLPHHLKAVKCSTIAHLRGAQKAKHYLRDLCGPNHALYSRIYNAISGESHWQAGAKNPSSSATGYAQFLRSWWGGVRPPSGSGWRWNPKNGILNIRIFYYVVTHPASQGGWSNWAGH